MTEAQEFIKALATELDAEFAQKLPPGWHIIVFLAKLLKNY